MSELEIVKIPLLKDNYGYVLHDPETRVTAVVDPSEAGPVLELLQKRGWGLHYILNTHHHHDHTGGNEELRQKTGCKVIASSLDRMHLPYIDLPVREGSMISIGRAQAYVLETPGHTLGHICFWFSHQQALFCGDTLFSLGCGRMFEGSPEQLWTSIRRLADLPRDTKVYCGHEYTEENSAFALALDAHNPALQNRCQEVRLLRSQGLPTVPSTIAQEVETNPFLRAPLLKEVLGLPDHATAIEAFTRVRQLKDSFSPTVSIKIQVQQIRAALPA